MPNFKISVDKVECIRNYLNIDLQVFNCMPNNCSISKIYLDIDGKQFEAYTYGENYSIIEFRDEYLHQYESESFKIKFETTALSSNKDCKIRFVTPMGDVSFDLKIAL